MIRFKRVSHDSAVGTALRTAPRMYGHSRRGTLNRSGVMAQVSGRGRLRAASVVGAALRDPPAPATLSAAAPKPLGLFETKSGLDITQKVIELLWLAAERNYLTVEIVQEAFSGDALPPDDMAEVRRTLGQAGVYLVNASAVKSVKSAVHTAAEESAHLKTQSGSVRNCVPQAGEAQRSPLDAETALAKLMEDADHERRQILYSFGFTAHEHIIRAEKLLVYPSEETFEHLVVDSEIQSRLQYLQRLPDLVKQVRKLDQKAAATYRRWRQARGRSEGEAHGTEFRKLDHKLQQTFPKFCYQTKVIQEMTRLAQNIAARLQASERVLQQAGRCRDSVCQMPLIDVEQQTIETMEEFVRMPSEVFQGHCTRLRAAGARFQQARCELIQGHLHLVASLAATHANRGLTLPELIRAGIFGLIHAVEKFRYRYEGRFSTYAACWIRQSIHGALATQPRHVSRPAPAAVSEGDKSSHFAAHASLEANTNVSLPQAGSHLPVVC